jgi:hypothetical protein
MAAGTRIRGLERMTGIEPALSAWEAAGALWSTSSVVAVTSIYNILITLLCIFGQKIGQKIAGAWNLWKPVQRNAAQ